MVLPFLYHANAHALSGHLTRPENILIQVQAGTTLPATGGQHMSRVENYRCGEMVSFASAYSHVCGSEKVEGGKTYHTTLVTTAIEKLNIFDMVTADRVVTRLASSYDSGGESSIHTHGSRIEGLRVAGCLIECELYCELSAKLDTFEKTRNEYASNPEFRKMAGDPFNPGKSPDKIDPCGIIRWSLVKQLKPPCPCITYAGHHGHVLIVPEFGKVYLAELSCEYGRKRLTMIRVELGSPNGGGVSAAEGESNGRPPT
jgi:hypothetical protein